VVVNPAYNLEEDELALYVASELADDELDTQLEIGELFKRIVLLNMITPLVIEGCRISKPEHLSSFRESVNSSRRSYNY